MNTRRTATVLLALLATAPTAVGPARGGPFVPCPTCVDDLLICCPKPCAIFDRTRVAGESAQLLGHLNTLDSYTAQNFKWAKTATVLGPKGARNNTLRRCPKRLLAHVRGAERELEHAADPALASERGLRADLKTLRHRETAHADETLQLLALELGHAEEAMALASDAVQGARDVRDYVRRAAELELATTRMLAIAARARAQTKRLIAGETAWADVALHDRRRTRTQ